MPRVVIYVQMLVAVRLFIGRRELHEREIQLHRGPTARPASQTASRSLSTGLHGMSCAVPPCRLPQLVHHEKLLVCWQPR